MSLQAINRDELMQVLSQLEQALYNHQQWHNDLLRTLICRLPPDKHDIDPMPHKECRFGQWVHNYSLQKIHDNPGFIAIRTAHERMHNLASTLLVAAQSGGMISPLDYDHFANALEQLRLEIMTLKNEIEVLLYNRDPLTGAINRVNMLPLLREQQELVKRIGHPCTIVMMDIDYFKQINDTHGHAIGDQVLAAVIRCTIESLRPYDKVFRYGGEEFILCLQNTCIEEAKDIIERLRITLANTPIEVAPKTQVKLTVSFGLCLLNPALPVEDSIACADKAMYRAKEAGRNRLEIYS